ncbi:MAG: TldD/PmbA family protein [Actinomycetota bacterium]|nr:TldD/PmbA family protein [Actinomycetota bacterium]
MTREEWPSELCERALDLVDQRAEVQVTASTTHLGLTRFANSGIHQHVGEEVTSVAMKVAIDGRVATVDTTRIDERGLSALAERALAAASVRPVDPDWPGLAPPGRVPDLSHDDPATRSASPDERAVVVADFVAAGSGLGAAGYVDTEANLVAFANSAGQRAAGRATRATIDGIHQTATSAGKAHQTARRLAELDGAAAGTTAARLARDSADPRDLSPGTYEVVLSPECVATILIFLAFYGFNAKMHLEGQSFAVLGEKQFDPALSLWDDATDPHAIGLGFDAEGSPKRRLDLVEEGTTTSLAHDRRTARRAGTETTGHAVPGGDAWGAFPTNLFLAPGEASFEQLVADIDRGLVVTEFNYCRVLDPKTQVVTGLTRNGTFLVKGGEIVRPVSNLRFTQSFVDALAPGRVLGLAASARYADAEFGPGLVHAPAMRLAGWHFTGGAQG